MFDFFIAIINSIQSIIAFVFSLIDSLFILISNLVVTFEIASRLIYSFPEPLINVATLSITVFVFYIIIGR